MNFANFSEKHFERTLTIPRVQILLSLDPILIDWYQKFFTGTSRLRAKLPRSVVILIKTFAWMCSKDNTSAEVSF